MKYFNNTMLIRIVFIFSYLTISENIANAQTDTDDVNFNNLFSSNMSIIDMSNPDVKQIQRQNLSSVKEYSGKANLSIPIFRVKSGNIDYPISINYDTGGVKVAQEASSVGLGWSLSNIIISRKIMDGQDFEEMGKSESEENTNPSHYLSTRIMGYFKYKSNNSPPQHRKLSKIDYLPDIYTVYLPSATSSFYYKDISTPKEMTTNEIKIESFVNTEMIANGFTFPTKDFFSFKITDAKGLVYEFNEYDAAYFHTEPWFSDTDENVPQLSNWYITKITDPSTNNNIDFLYEDAISGNFYTNEISRYGQRRTRTHNFSSTSGCYGDLIEYLSPYASAYYFSQYGQRGYGCSDNSLMYDVITNTVKNYRMRRLKKVSFPEGYLVFEYDFTRQDIPSNGNNKALSKIKLFDYNNKQLKEFVFNYDYFLCTTSETAQGHIPADEDCKRLKLVSIQETGLPPHTFEYVDDNSLPRKSSRAIDFLGYYNGTHVRYDDQPRVIIPKLYYYPNKGAWSILPFDIPNEEYYELKDKDHIEYPIVNRKSNFTYTKKGVLKKVNFPTGGHEEFEYELNSFQVFGQTINGGGLRVKKQILDDGNGNQTYINYQYLNDDNISSGQLTRPPMYGFPQGQLFTSYYELNPPDQNDPPGEIVTNYQGFPNWNDRKIYNTFFIGDTNSMDMDINNGLYIGYSQVKKIYSDGSFEKLRFTSRSDYPDKRGFGFFGYNEDIENKEGEIEEEETNNNYFGNIPIYSLGSYGEFLQTNSNFEGAVYTDFSKNRGNLLSVEKYNTQNVLKRLIEYNYEKVDFGNEMFIKPIYSPHYKYASTSDQFPGKPEYIMTVIHYGNARINYTTSRFKPISIKETEYLDSSSGIKEHITEQKIRYVNNPFSNRVSEVEHSIYEENSTHQNAAKTSVLYDFRYPDDPNLPYNNSAITDLRNRNRLNNVIEVEKHKVLESNGGGGTLLIESKVNKYVKDGTTSQLPLIGNVEIHKGETFNVASYKYDNKGNVIEYTLESGTPVSIIWGYKQLYPIAKIEGISYSSIPTTLIINAVNASLADNDSGFSAVKEGLLRTALNAFRTNSTLVNANVLITTYTHDPLIGLTSVTDPIGLTGYYKYDVNGRLEKVIDENGKDLQRFEYNIPTP